jgi:hypothetical protein
VGSSSTIKIRIQAPFVCEPADDPAGARVDIDDHHLAAVHELERIDHLARIELRAAEIGHIVVGRARTDIGDQAVERDNLPLRRRFAQIVLIAIAIAARSRGTGCSKQQCRGNREGQGADHAGRFSPYALNRR